MSSSICNSAVNQSSNARPGPKDRAAAELTAIFALSRLRLRLGVCKKYSCGRHYLTDNKRGLRLTPFKDERHQNGASENCQHKQPAEIGNQLPRSHQRGTEDEDRNTDYTRKCGSAGSSKQELHGRVRRRPKPAEQSRDSIRKSEQAACQADDHRG